MVARGARARPAAAGDAAVAERSHLGSAVDDAVKLPRQKRARLII